MRTIRLLTAATCLVLLSPGVGAARLQDRMATPSSTAAVKVVPVRTGLDGPSGFTFSPRGNIWYLERGTGEVRIINRRTGTNHLFFTIGGVDGPDERLHLRPWLSVLDPGRCELTPRVESTSELP